MPETLLRTKLCIPPLRTNIVSRPHLVERLKQGLGLGPSGFTSKLTLVSAPAGFGKTTLLTEWISQSPIDRRAWLSLDEGDNDPARFLGYFVASLLIDHLPPLPLPRLRIQITLKELRAAGLRFTTDEITSLFNIEPTSGHLADGDP